MTELLYHLIAVNDKTDYKEYLTSYPDTHKNCMTMKSRFTPHPDVRIMVEEFREVEDDSN